MTTGITTSRRTLLAASTATVLAAGVAFAQAETLDTDGDGMVSYAELLVAVPDVTEDDFTTLDLNADGMLDADEIAAAEEAGLISLG